MVGKQLNRGVEATATWLGMTANSVRVLFAIGLAIGGVFGIYVKFHDGQIHLTNKTVQLKEDIDATNTEVKAHIDKCNITRATVTENNTTLRLLSQQITLQMKTLQEDVTEMKGDMKEQGKKIDAHLMQHPPRYRGVPTPEPGE